MTTTEHTQTAREFLEKSDRYFAEGDELQGSEKMWGAAAHSVMAVAQQRGWSFGDPPLTAYGGQDVWRRNRTTRS